MGCDIHICVEVRDGAGWRKLPAPPKLQDKWYAENYPDEAARHWVGGNRNYLLFSLLANVRNYNDWTPFAEPRGLPPDTFLDPEHDDLGDHSFSYFTLAELQEQDWKSTERDGGIIDWAQFLEFNGYGPPGHWCGGISGPGVFVLDEAAADDIRRQGWVPGPGRHPHVSVSWPIARSVAGGAFYAELMPGLASLAHDPSDIRVVFGFDS